MEQRDGGRTGPVDRRDLLIEEARRHLAGLPNTHQLPGHVLDESESYKKALEEVEKLTRDVESKA